MQVNNETRRVVYHGQVQGVGFRWTTHRIAQDHAVTGYVKNLSDGTVELLVRGQPARLAAFLEELRQRMLHNIERIDAVCLDSDMEFDGFRIRY